MRSGRYVSAVRLDEFDKNEWWDACRKVRPDLSRAEFEAMWSEFAQKKAQRERQGSVH